MAVFTVILAGGKGERFWPKSREAVPKQFVRLTDQGSMLQLTFERATKLTAKDNIFVVTGQKYFGLVAEQLPHLPEANIIIEPEGRNTAPCIGLAAIVLEYADPEAVMVVLPADHYIAKEERFVEAIGTAVELASAEDAFVTLGIVPTRPETGYGYIQLGSSKELNHRPYYEVDSFKEKPDYERAQGYITAGNYLWNSGMFIWKTGSLLKAMERYTPELYEGLKQLRLSVGKENWSEVLNKVFGTLPKESIDYAILEKAGNILVVPGDFGWDDVGSWAALPRLFEVDEWGNFLQGSVVTLDAQNCIIEGKTKLIAAVGIEDLVVIDTEDVILICPKEKAQDVKLILEQLRNKKMDKYL